MTISAGQEYSLYTTLNTKTVFCSIGNKLHGLVIGRSEMQNKILNQYYYIVVLILVWPFKASFLQLIL